MKLRVAGQIIALPADWTIHIAAEGAPGIHVEDANGERHSLADAAELASLFMTTSKPQLRAGFDAMAQPGRKVGGY